MNCAALAWILIPGDLANNELYCGAYLNTFYTATAANHMAMSGAVRRELQASVFGRVMIFKKCSTPQIAIDAENWSHSNCLQL